MHVIAQTLIQYSGTDAIDRNYLIAALIRFLPEEHTTLLKYIVDFMAELSLHTDSNKMGLHNLATVIGPNIMRNPQDEAMSLIQDVVSVNSIAYALIKSREEIFEVCLLSVSFMRAIVNEIRRGTRRELTPHAVCVCITSEGRIRTKFRHEPVIWY